MTGPFILDNITPSDSTARKISIDDSQIPDSLFLNYVYFKSGSPPIILGTRDQIQGIEDINVKEASLFPAVTSFNVTIPQARIIDQFSKEALKMVCSLDRDMSSFSSKIFIIPAVHEVIDNRHLTLNNVAWETVESGMPVANVFPGDQVIPTLLIKVLAAWLAYDLQQKLEIPEIRIIDLIDSLVKDSSILPTKQGHFTLIGRAFIKRLKALCLVHENQDSDSGGLTYSSRSKSKVDYIISHCNKVGLYKFALDPSAIQKNNTDIIKGLKYDMKNKVLLFAILGAAIKSGGFRTAIKCSSRLGYGVDSDTTWEKLVNHFNIPSMDLGEIEEHSKVEQIINYVFENRSNLKRALTHRTVSYDHRANLDIYEYLGDADLEYFTTSNLVLSYPSKSVKELDKLRQDLLSNTMLAKVAISNKLLGSIIHDDKELKDCIPNITCDEVYFKDYGDSIEALNGSILYDSKMNLEATQKFQSHLMYPTFREHIANPQLLPKCKELKSTIAAREHKKEVNKLLADNRAQLEPSTSTLLYQASTISGEKRTIDNSITPKKRQKN